MRRIIKDLYKYLLFTFRYMVSQLSVLRKKMRSIDVTLQKPEYAGRFVLLCY